MESICNHFSFILASGNNLSVLWKAFSQDFHIFLQVEIIILSDIYSILFYFFFPGEIIFCTFCIFLLTVAILFLQRKAFSIIFHLSLQVKNSLLSREKHFQSFFIYFFYWKPFFCLLERSF